MVRVSSCAPLLEKERINLDIPHWMILKIDRVARRKGMSPAGSN
jgi:hypothetical protein